MPRKRRIRIDAVVVAVGWVVGSALCVVTGWGLSAMGALNPHGYAIVGATAVAIAVGIVAMVRPRFHLVWRPSRWRRILPVAFLILAIAATAGGVFYPPTNIDALTYRLPRLMHWLDAGRWHWIETQHLRMNYSAVGAEWLYAPVLAISRSVRWLFVSSVLSYLLLPGLLFTWLAGLGAAAKTAWRWMWVTPMALGLALQAGSMATDLLGVVYLLAALVFAQRAAQDGQARWIILAAVALGLATNIKASNLAWVPFAVVPMATGWRTLQRRRVAAAMTALVLGLAVSGVPTLALNMRHTGHWSGDPQNQTAVRPDSARSAVTGNLTLIALQNLAPPFFPAAGAWNTYAENTLMPRWRAAYLGHGFPRFTMRLGELPQEEWAGLGLPFLLLGIVELWLGRGRRRQLRRDMRVALWAGAAGFTVFVLTMGSEMPARLALPFYLVPIAAIAALSAGASVSHSRLWRGTAGLAFVTAIVAVMLTPARPLFPAERIFAALQQRWPGSTAIERAARVYSVYATRYDMLAAVRDDLPAGEATIAFLATDDDSDWSLWLRPGTSVVHVDSLQDPRLQKIRVVAVRADVFWPDQQSTVAALTAAGFRVRAEHSIIVKAARPPERWAVATR